MNKFLSYVEGGFIFFPEIFLFLSIIIIFIKYFFSISNDFNNLVNKFCLMGLFITLLIMILINFESLGFPYLTKLSFFHNNLKVIIITCSIIVFLIFKSSVDLDKTYFLKFHVLCMLSTLGMLIVVTSTNFISLFLALELQMIPIYILCNLNQINSKSFNLSIKFFLVYFLSSLFILFGMLMIYEYSSLIAFKDIISVYKAELNSQILIGFLFLFSGIIFKIFSTIFYLSIPDLFDSIPIPIALFIMTSSFVSFAGILLLCTFNFMDGNVLIWKRTILTLSILTMFIGSFGMFLQKKIKRFLGFFSIASAGFVFLEISLMSSKGFEKILLYLITYVLLLFGIFSTIILLKKDGKPIEYLLDLSNLSTTKPFISLTLLVFLFSMSGIPPFGGFFSKWILLSSFIESNNIYILLSVVLSSFLVTFSCLKIIKIIYFENSEFQFNIDYNSHLKLIILLCIIINAFMFVFISFLFDIINVSNSIF